MSQLLNVHGVNDIRQREIHTTEPLVPEPSVFEFELAIEKLKSNISPGIDQIPAELIKASDRTILYEIHKLINSIWNRFFNFDVEYTIWRVQVNQDGLKLNCTHQLLVYIDDVNVLRGRVHTAGFKSVLGDRIS